MRKKNIIIILMLIVVVIIVIISLLLIIMTRNDSSINNTNAAGELAITEIYDLDETKVDSLNSYYLIDTIVDNYFLYLSYFTVDNDEARYFELGRYSTEEELEAERLEYKKKVYNLLSREYIEENNINIENIEEHLGTFHNTVVFIDDIRRIFSDAGIANYYADGYVVEKETLEKTEFSMKIITDVANVSFAIYPSGHGFDIEKNKPRDSENFIYKEIENNGDNKYIFRTIDDSIRSREIFQSYKYMLKYDIEGAYNHLDENYREARFGDFNAFKKYIEENSDNISNLQLSKYQITEKDGYTQYIFIDTNDNYYILRETDIMKYSVLLDTYTVDIPEFVEKYKEVNAQEKVILNLDKFRKAINDKNYRYAYSVLSDRFKANYFKTQEDFENYVKANFFENNEFSYGTFGNEADAYYTYEVEIKDNTNSDGLGEVKKKTFIMELKDGTDFEMSFNV